MLHSSDRWSSTVTIAGTPVGVTIDGASAVEAVLPAVEHLVPTDDPGPVTATLTVQVNDDPLAGCRWPAGPVRSGEAVGMVRRSPDSLDLFRPGWGMSMTGVPDTFSDASVRAQPASSALSGWLATRGSHVLHLGAVSFDGRGAVLIGSGGAGKSTTAVACALSGADFLGDDFCIVRAGAGDPTVHSLYATAKLADDSYRLLGRPGLTTVGRTGDHKRVVALSGAVPIVTGVPIRALVVLRPSGTAADDVRRVPPGRALRAWAATGITTAIGAVGARQWLDVAVRIVGAVPAYDVPLVPDSSVVVDRIRAVTADAP